METLLTIIFWTVMLLLILMLNTFVTKELTEIVKDSWFDNRILYRICLIPPIAFIVFCGFIILFVIGTIISMIRDIWK